MIKTVSKPSNMNGFSLVELMVVVSIIGTLSIVAVPNFLKFQAKAKQVNAKTELAGIYTAQAVFNATTNKYSSNLPYIGYIPDGVPLDSNNCPSYNTYDSNWSRRYYRVGYKDILALTDPLWGAASCGVATTGISNVEVYTEVPKNSFLSAFAVDSGSMGLYGMVNGFTAANHGCGSESGPCAVGVIYDDMLDVWVIDRAKTLTNVSNGI